MSEDLSQSEISFQDDSKKDEKNYFELMPKFEAPEETDTLIKGSSTQYVLTKYQIITAMKEYEKKSVEELRVDFYKFEGKFEYYGATENSFFNGILKVLDCEELKDFTVKIDEHEFKVHKLILAARSPTLAEMIKNNPDADELILEDIEVEVFKVILDYIYNVEIIFSKNNEKILAAADKLKIEPLKQKFGNCLCQAVTAKNSLAMLKLASKHKHENLKLKSFEEFKKLFPDDRIKDEMIDNIELLEKFIDGKNAYEEKLRQAQEEFERLLSNN